MEPCTCETCGRRMKWSRGMAGRQVLCACGAAVVLPEAPPPAAQLDEAEGEYDLAPEAPRKQFALPAPPPAPEAPAAGAPPVLAYRTPASGARSPRAADPETIKNFYMPLWLLGLGLAIEIIAAFVRERQLDLALRYVGVGIILQTLTMLAGMLLAARFRGIDLGRFWIAAFKLSAIAIAPSATVTLLNPLLNILPFGGIIGLIIAFIFYFALLGALFDLDESDTWYCVCVIFLIRVALYFLLLWMKA